MTRKFSAHSTKGSQSVAVAASLSALLLALAACASSAPAGSSGVEESANEVHTAVAELPPAELERLAAKEMMSLGDPVRWPGADSGPEPASDATVGFMPCNLQIEVCRFMADQFEDAARTIGFDGMVLDGQGDPTKQQSAVDIALNQGMDCLITMAAPVRDIAPQAARMRQDGLPIVEAFGGQDGDVLVGVNQKNAGAALASYVLTHGGGDIIVTNIPQLHELTIRTEGFIEYIERFGKGKAEVVGREDFTLAELGPGQESKTRALLAKYPSATWFYSAADVGLYAPLDFARQEGRSLKGLGFDGEPAAYADLRDGPDKGRGVTATISWGLDWVVWSSVDECNRAMQGAEAGVNKDHPIMLTDHTNVPASGGYEPSLDFRAEFRKLWGAG